MLTICFIVVLSFLFEHQHKLFITTCPVDNKLYEFSDYVDIFRSCNLRFEKPVCSALFFFVLELVPGPKCVLEFNYVYVFIVCTSLIGLCVCLSMFVFHGSSELLSSHFKPLSIKNDRTQSYLQAEGQNDRK